MLVTLMQERKGELMRYLEDIRLGTADICDLVEYGLVLLDAACSFGKRPQDLGQLKYLFARSAFSCDLSFLDELRAESADWSAHEKRLAARLLQRAFFAEGIIRRASASPARDELVFYGSILNTALAGPRRRVFEDIDVIMSAAYDDPAMAEDLLRAVLDEQLDDGICYRVLGFEPLVVHPRNPDAVGECCRKETGLRLLVAASFEDMQEIITVDAVTIRADLPWSDILEYRPMFGGETILIRACAPDLLIAMKLHRLVDNSDRHKRTKDLYDIHTLVQAQDRSTDIAGVMACYQYERDTFEEVWLGARAAGLGR